MSEHDPRRHDSNVPMHPVPAVSDPSVPASSSPMPPFAAPWDAEPKPSGFNFWAFLHSFRRRWLLGVGLGCLIASTLAALLWVFVPIKSEAIVTLQVFRHNDEMLSLEYKPAAHPQDFEIKKQTQISILRSPFVASAALRQPGIGQLPLVRYKPWFGKRENPLAWLDKQLKVESAEGSELVEISMKAPFSQRDDLVKLLNAIKDAYIREVIDGDATKMRSKLEKLKKRQRELSRDVRDQLEQISELTKAYGSIDSEQVQVQLDLKYQQLAALQSDRRSLQQRWNEAYDQYILHQSRMTSVRGRDFPEYKIEDALLQAYPEYAALKEQQIELKYRLGLSGGRGGMLGGGAQLQQQMQMLQQQMENFKMEHREEAKARLMSMENMDTTLMEDEMRMLTTQLQSLQQRREANAKEIERVQNEISQMGDFNGDLAVRQLDLESDQEMLARIDQEVQSLELDMAQRPKIEVLQDAIIPDTEGNWFMKYMQIVAAWCATFMGTLLGIALWDMQHQRVNNSQEVSDVGDIRVIGSLPALNSRRAGGLLPASGEQRRVVETTLMRSIDSIRTALLFARSDRPYEAIMVTSALGNEGKTTVASQLAVSFARSGRRTLLIDGDIRNPQQHIVLGMPMAKGLSEVLRSECKLDDVLQTTSAQGLWSLSAGFRDAYTDQVMASSVVTKLFAELRSRFDTIVIDTGPTLTSPDAMLLGQHADTTVISVRRDVSRLPKVNDAVERLQGVGIKIAGVVLNGTGVDIRENESKQLANQDASRDPQLEEVASAATSAAAVDAAAADSDEGAADRSTTDLEDGDQPNV